MKNYKKIIIGSIMTAIIIASPIASFAKENGNKNEERKEERGNKLSWFFSSWFHNQNKNNVTITTPVISNLTATSSKSQKATIKWDTSARSNSMVWYSTTSPVDTSSNPTLKRNDRVSKHKFEIKKLQPNTKYYVVVGSSNTAGIVKSSEISFTTGSTISDNIKPVITSATGPATIKVGESSSFTIKAYDPNNKSLSYEIMWGDDKVTTNSFNQTETVNHTYEKAGTYLVKVIITNSDGYKVNYSMQVKVTSVTNPDTTAPVITEKEVKTNGSNVTISWKTNEKATSEVFYSTNSGVNVNDANTSKTSNLSLKTNHSMNLPSLTPNTLYHFVLKSTDASSNVAISSESKFTTN